jgi:Zn-dependent protease with chaperone function
MDDDRFNAIVARLETESREAPARYQFKVGLLAVAGFGLLFLIMGGAALGILLLAVVAIAVVMSAGKAALLLIKLAKVLWVLVIPLWLLLKSSLAALFTRLPPPTGHELRRGDAPALFAAMDELRKRMRGPRFHHVLVTMEMNAAVVQRPLFGLAGLPRNYLILGLPLLESLAPDEALAVVGHEYGHLAGSHSHFAAWIYRLRLTWGTIYALSEQWTGWAGRGLRKLVHLYAPYFNAYTWVLARANEYQADAAAAELGSPAIAANALKRVNVASGQYDAFMTEVYGGVRLASAPPADLSDRWSRAAREVPPAVQAGEWLRQSLEREKQVHDTHPVLRERLAALPGEAARVAELPPPLTGPSAATAWLGPAAAALRQKLQADWAQAVDEGWRQRYGEIEEQRRRLTELRGLASPSADETVERLNLQVRLEPEADVLPGIQAFNAATPDHAGGLYLEGSVRCDRDDAAGVPLLEQVMVLDPEAVTAVCEHLYRFYRRSGDTVRAEAYADRYRARQKLEAERYAQFHNFDPAHAIAPYDLGDEDISLIRTIIAARRKSGIARAWVVRRILPADESIRIYVVCIDPAWWARLLQRAPQIIAALNESSWPMPATLCVLIGANRKALLPRLKGLVPLALDRDP